MSMSHRKGLSRADKRRNARLARLRAALPRENAILAIDLADRKQVLVVTDHDSRVLARRTGRCRAWELGDALTWGVDRAREAGFASVTVACEPTGHRWRVVGELCALAGLTLVCAQPLLVRRAREAEDYTRDKSDAKDALLIARLAAELRVYLPEEQDPVWARLRHLAARRTDVISQAGSARQRLRDLLECAWPAALDAAADPLDSSTWRASVAVALRLAGRGGGAADLTLVRRTGWTRFAAAVTRELPAWGGRRRCHRIMRAVYEATTCQRGVLAHRPGGLERAGFALADWQQLTRDRGDVEDRMVAVLDQLDLTGPARRHPRAVRGRRRGDPRRDRRPGPLRHRPRPGQARRAVSAGQRVRPPHRPDHHLPARPPPAAAGRLAGRLGRDPAQPGARRPPRPPDQPPAQPAHRPAGPRRRRRQPAPPAARRGDPPRPLGPRHRRRRPPPRPHGGERRLTPPTASPTGGASSPPRRAHLVDQHEQPQPAPPKLE
jgi:transposase